MDEFRIRWETPAHERSASAQLADVDGIGRILVRRDRKGARTFTGLINGEIVARGNCLQECQSKTAKVARERWEAAHLPVSGGGREGAMTEIEALELVRNMAYDFDNQGNVLHDLIAQTGGSGSAVRDQTRAIDAIDAMLFRLKVGSQNDAAKPAEVKTPGQSAYERDVARRPLYDDGTPRKTWDQLPDYAQQSWELNPTDR